MAAGAETQTALARYAAGEFSLAELARALRVTRREARAALDRGGIGVRNPGRPVGSSPLAAVLTEDYLRRELLGRRRAVAELAAEVGCTAKTVRRYLVASGIADTRMRPVRAGGRRGPGLPAHHDEDRSSRPGARPIGGGPGEGDGLADRVGDGGPGPAGTGMSRDELWEAYVVRAASTSAIAAAAGCAPSTVARDLRRHGITLRRPGGAPPPDVRRHTRRAGIRRAVQSADR